MTRRADDTAERMAIVLAMARIVAREDLPSNKFTIVELAKEAGVSRSRLTEKHLDLKGLFQRMASAQQDGNSHSQHHAVRDQNVILKRKLQIAKDEAKGLLEQLVAAELALSLLMPTEDYVRGEDPKKHA